MKSFFTDKLEYNRKCNSLVIELVESNPEAFSDRVKDLLSHTLNAQHFWNLRILGKTPKISVWEQHELIALGTLNEEFYTSSISIIENYEITKVISYRTTKGMAYEDTIEDILYHVVNHGTYHRGQLISELKSLGVSPVATDFIFFKR